MNEILVDNQQVLSWFAQCESLDKTHGLIPRKITDLSSAEYACAESTLREFLNGTTPYKKLRSMDFFGETAGGEFFNQHMLDYLGNPRWYTSCYYPSGFMGWHEDSCAAGYLIMFSYSESGQGMFKYHDRDSDTVIELPDKPGWVARSGFTGSTSANAWWHCVSSECPRWTWIYIWDTYEEQQLAISRLTA
jgi:hypothetical protein